MDLYIANGTRQIISFMYRVPEAASARTQTIRIGGQVKISGRDISQAAVDGIIEQHRKYGLIDAADVGSGRSPAPMCFSVGKPVSADRIAQLMRRNDRLVIEQGREARKNAAIVMTTNLGASMRDSGTGGELDEVQIDVTEERSRGASPDGDLLVESTVVSRESDTGGPRPRRTTRRAA